MKKCPNCGAVWPDSEHFCQNCGEVLPQAQPEPSAPLQAPEQITPAGAPQPAKAKPKKHLVLLIIIIAAAAAAVICAMLYLNSRNDRYNHQINLANQYFANRQYDRALKAYNAAGRIKPKAPRPYEGKAQVYLAQKKYGRALKTLNKIGKNDRTANTQVTYANIKRRQGSSKKSVRKYYKQALSQIPGEVKRTKNKSERKEILNLYQEIFETVRPTDAQTKTAAETIEKYGDDEMLMGVTNNNAIVKRAVAAEVSDETEGGSFVQIGENVYHLFGNKILKDDADGKTTTVYTHSANDEDAGLGNLNYYMGYFYFTYGNQFIFGANMHEYQAKVYKIRPDGTDLKKIATSDIHDTTYSELIVYDGRVYFGYCKTNTNTTDTIRTKLVSYDLNGGNKKTLTSSNGEDESWLFGIDGGHLYQPVGNKVVDINLSDNSKQEIDLGNYTIKHFGCASYFTIDDGVLYGISYNENNHNRVTVFSMNLNTKKTKVIQKNMQDLRETKEELFAKDGQCYYVAGRFDESSDTPFSLEIQNMNGDELVSADDYYRAALMDDEIWVEDSKGKMHYYKLDGSEVASEEDEEEDEADDDDAATQTDTSDFETYDGHKYQRIDTHLSWTDASKACKAAGGHLATITSSGEQAFVATLIDDGNCDAYWLGGKVSGDSITWVTKESESYTHWAYGEPNGGNYLQIYAVTSNKGKTGNEDDPYGKWDDTYNDGDSTGITNEGYIIEID